ncbi:MAG: MFS transporter [Chloroflexota bacterium]
MNPSTRPTGLRAFFIIWITQIISILTSGMTGFAFSIWLYQKTESATAMGLMQVFYITPFLLMSPLAGVMVDRYSRKLMMMISDISAGMGTIFILFLFLTGNLEFWHLYVAAALNGIGNTFQWPAYSAAISVMVPKEQLGRVNGLMSLMEAGPGVLAPIAAGALLPLIGIQGILILDITTFLLAILALSYVFIPRPAQSDEGKRSQGSFFKEALFGFEYIFKRPSLLGLQLIFLAANLFSGIGYTLLAPMILAKTNQNSLIFGTVQSMFAAGSVAGGIIMSIWGGFKKRVHGVLLGWLALGIGMMIMGLSNTLSIWVGAAIFINVFGPLINSSNQAIWQSKVHPDLQGRVFSARRLIAWLTTPISPIIAGTLADFVFEPIFRNPYHWMVYLTDIFGKGAGTGMGFLFFLCGICVMIVGIGGYFFKSVRDVEEVLPDVI